MGLLFANAPAQVPTDSSQKVNEYYEILLEQLPTPVGGYTSLQEKLYFPDGNYSMDFEAHLLIWISIDSQGQVADYKIVNKNCAQPFCDSAVNAITSINWNPAYRNGVPVSVGMYLPITFKMQ